MKGRTFREALIEFDASIADQAAKRPFNLVVDGGFVTRTERGGVYIAYINGQTYIAVSDGPTGVGADGKYHFSVEDNPLG